MTLKWKILCLLLFLGNLGLAYWLFETKLDLTASESDNELAKVNLARRSAEADFNKNLLRIFEMRLDTPDTHSNTLAVEFFSGKSEGPYQVWSVPLTSAMESKFLRARAEYYNAYNEQMDVLFRNKDVPKSRPGVGGQPFRGGIPVPPLDSHSNFYNCSVEIRILASVRLDPLIKYLSVHEKSTSAAYGWLTKAPLREENGFKVREYGFTIFPQRGRQEVVVEPGYHPAQIFHLHWPNPLKATDWTGWQMPDYIEPSNTIAAYKRDLDPKFTLADLPSNCFQVRYKIEAVHDVPTPLATGLSRTKETVLLVGRESLTFWALFLAGWFFVEWMDKPIRKPGRPVVQSPGIGSTLKFRRSQVACPFCGQNLRRGDYWSWSLGFDRSSHCPACRQRLQILWKPLWFWAVLLTVPVGVSFARRLETWRDWVYLFMLGVPACAVIIYILSPYFFQFDPAIGKKAE